ncbi:Fe-S cluster assembly sulfur transfer protein SufU [Spiroplasma endosymbiont of Amphibalanus improvisus]|uniref:Fe-S cluster assembly sulfur transfer protein SufU n=1 Tax=Spiroplasma endosymbiont of Amphibalanus improvisus TaxID=3066327 RepID=UPI00313B01D5
MNFKDLVNARQIIIDNYSDPENKKFLLDKNAVYINQSSESCIDNITVELLFKDDLIEEARFEGEGCAISISSTNIMAKILKSKTITQAKEIINQYNNMISNKICDEKVLEELIVFSNVYKQPNRIRCSLIGIDGYHKLIKSKNNKEDK